MDENHKSNAKKKAEEVVEILKGLSIQEIEQVEKLVRFSIRQTKFEQLSSQH